MESRESSVSLYCKACANCSSLRFIKQEGWNMLSSKVPYISCAESLFTFYWSNNTWIKLFIPDNGVKMQVSVLTHECGDWITWSS